MFYLLGLLVIPVIVCGGGMLLFQAQITRKEFALTLGIALLVAVGGWFIARWGALQDTEVWGGRITAKNHGSQKCCHCYTVCGASISPQYLAYKQLEIMGRAADGENNMIFIPYTETANGQMQLSQWTKPEALLDSALLAKVNQLKHEADKKGGASTRNQGA